jgi:colicin import membrane protein
MKKAFSALLVFLFLSLTTNSFAQTVTDPQVAAAKAKAKADRKAARDKAKADKRSAEDKATADKVAADDKASKKTMEAADDAAKTKADADKKAAKAKAKADRKAAKEVAKVNAKEKDVTMPAATKQVTQVVNRSADKAVGTDAKGRTIYQGARGGQYTLTANGNKEYIKKAK